MPEYRKKPVVVEARRIDSSDYDAMCGIAAWCGGRAVDHDGAVIAIDTLEGTMLAAPGDWVIRGVAGEFYPCRDGIFRETYEPASEPGSPVIDLDDLALALGAVEDAQTGETTPERYSAWCRVRRAVSVARAKVDTGA